MDSWKYNCEKKKTHTQKKNQKAPVQLSREYNPL